MKVQTLVPKIQNLCAAFFIITQHTYKIQHIDDQINIFNDKKNPCKARFKNHMPFRSNNLKFMNMMYIYLTFFVFLYNFQNDYDILHSNKCYQNDVIIYTIVFNIESR